MSVCPGEDDLDMLTALLAESEGVQEQDHREQADALDDLFDAAEEEEEYKEGVEEEGPAVGRQGEDTEDEERDAERKGSDEGALLDGSTVDLQGECLLYSESSAGQHLSAIFKCLPSSDQLRRMQEQMQRLQQQLEASQKVSPSSSTAVLTAGSSASPKPMTPKPMTPKTMTPKPMTPKPPPAARPSTSKRPPAKPSSTTQRAKTHAGEHAVIHHLILNSTGCALQNTLINTHTHTHSKVDEVVLCLVTAATSPSTAASGGGVKLQESADFFDQLNNADSFKRKPRVAHLPTPSSPPGTSHPIAEGLDRSVCLSSYLSIFSFFFLVRRQRSTDGDKDWWHLPASRGQR